MKIQIGGYEAEWEEDKLAVRGPGVEVKVDVPPGAKREATSALSRVILALGLIKRELED